MSSVRRSRDGSLIGTMHKCMEELKGMEGRGGISQGVPKDRETVGEETFDGTACVGISVFLNP